MTEKPRLITIDEIAEAVAFSDDPLDAAMQVLVSMMALATMHAPEEEVFSVIEELIKEARHDRNE